MRAANREIRQAATEAGIRLWQIAEALGTTDSGFSRRLRHELSPEEKKQVMDIIGSLSRQEVEK